MQAITGLFELGRDRYQPDAAFTYSNDPGYTLDQRWLAALVGVVALGLPVTMWVGTWLGVCGYYSISHFYYAQFLGGVFIAALVLIGTFMLAYRGENAAESRLATIAGLCALGVALFPTSGRGCDLTAFSGRALADFTLREGEDFVRVIPATAENPFFELFSGADYLHFASAAMLFAFLAYYSFFVFTRVIDREHRRDGQNLTRIKTTRNRIYIASGIAIVVSMLAILIHALYGFSQWDHYRLTFWFEALALWAFGISWMVKGRFFGTMLLDQRDMQAQAAS